MLFDRVIRGQTEREIRARSGRRGLLARQEARLDLEVVIPGYDTGRMSILVP
jgi:hypothetical protein